MKKYNSIGELFIDFRIFRNISQAEFAAKINVDIRTIQRWERNETLVKQEKEEEIANVTLFPYQLIRNLNALAPIPTYYDFRINKYAISRINSKLPEASWFKSQLENSSERVRRFDYDRDFDSILRNLNFHKDVPKNIIRVIHESAKILPEMNIVIIDDLGFYSGHTLIFPIQKKTFEDLKSKRILENELSISDLSRNRSQDHQFFYGYDITADSNDNMFYIVNHVLRFLRDMPNQNYTYCSTVLRYDSYKLVENLGLKIIWEDEIEKNNLGLELHRRFQEGDFKQFLND